MNTDLTDWLIAVDDEEKNLEQENLTETGLLLASVDDFVQHEESNTVAENINQSFAQLEIQEREKILNSENENLNFNSDFSQNEIQEREKILNSENENLNFNSDFSQNEIQEHKEILNSENENLNHEENYGHDNFELQKILIPENSAPYNINENPSLSASSISDEIYALQQTVQSLQDGFNNDSESFNKQDDNDENSLSNYAEQPQKQDNKWQEAATGFELSLDEPPPEHWQHLNASSDYNYDEDDENEDYERTTSLQGDAYIPKHEHGKNFTQRLKRTLKGRKDRAEAIREEEEKEKIHHHPYFSKALMMCASMLLTVALACFALIFLQRETPDGMNKRANALNEMGDYDGAMNLYEKAYKRYPDILTFLTGLADSAEKAGHVQTANIAWNEYINALPKDDFERRKFAENNLRRLNGEKEIKEIKEENAENEKINEKKTEEKVNESEQILEENKDEKKENQEIKNENEAENVQQEIKETETLVRLTNKLENFNILPVRPVFFADVLREGNNAYNLGLYDSAIIDFHRAIEIRETDARPYIGLAGAYKAKGMYFDAKRILDIARKKFRKNPTVEVGLKILKEAQ